MGYEWRIVFIGFVLRRRARFAPIFSSKSAKKSFYLRLPILVMKRVCFVILLLCALQPAASAQKAVLRTRAVHAYYGKNPNISLEIPLSTRWSLNAEYLYRRQIFLADFMGTYKDMGAGQHSATGYKTQLGFRRYLGEEHEAPFGWYLDINYTIDKIRTRAFYQYQESAYYTNDAYVFSLEGKGLNFHLGTQFSLFRCLAVDLFLGFSRYSTLDVRETIVASDSAALIGTSNRIWKLRIAPDAGCRIGFYF